MTLAVFPSQIRGLGFNVLKSPAFKTLVQSAPNEYETRIPQTTNPVWTFQLVYNYLKDFPLDLLEDAITTDFRMMMDFFLSNQGERASFLFTDPDDNYVGPAVLNDEPNAPLAQLQVVTDGAGNYYSPLQRTFGGTFYEDITDLNTSDDGGSTLAIYADGVLMTGGGVDYTLSTSPGLALPTASYMGLYIKWTGTNAPSAPTLSKVAGSLPAGTYFAKTTYVTSGGSGETTASAESSLAIGVGTPSAPTLSSSSGGSLGIRTEYYKITYVNSFGETVGSAEANLALTDGELANLASPAAAGDATSWNVYGSTSEGTETLQNGSPIAIGTPWVEPTSGLTTGGASVPGSTTALGDLVIDSPVSGRNISGWNAYVSNSSGAEEKQNSSPIAISTNLTVSSVATGAVPPAVDSSASPSAPVTAQFNFYFRVRWGTDSQDFEKFMNDLWCIGGDYSKNGQGTLTLRTARPNPL